MKVLILKSYKMMHPEQVVELPENYAKSLIKKGVAKVNGVEIEKVP